MTTWVAVSCLVLQLVFGNYQTELSHIWKKYKPVPAHRESVIHVCLTVSSRHIVGFPYLYSCVHWKGVQLSVLGFFFFLFWPSGCNYVTLCFTQASAAHQWTAAGEQHHSFQQGPTAKTVCNVSEVLKIKLQWKEKKQLTVWSNLSDQFNFPQSLSQLWPQDELLAQFHMFEVRSHTGSQHTVTITWRSTLCRGVNLKKDLQLDFIPNNSPWNELICSPIKSMIYVCNVSVLKT